MQDSETREQNPGAPAARRLLELAPDVRIISNQEGDEGENNGQDAAKNKN